MRIFINTFGSRGDVQPFVALGKRLQMAGHEVMICTAHQFETFITDHGLNYGYMTGELLKLIDTDLGREAMEDTVGLFGTMKSMMKLMGLGKKLNREMAIDSWHAAQKYEPELVIYHPKALAALSIAEKFMVPVIMANLQPMMAPTAAFPPIGIPPLKLGGWYNKLTYKAIGLGYRPYNKDVNDIRQNMMGLAKASSDVLHTTTGSPIPIMHAFSRHVLSAPPDWPDYYTVNGYWFLEPHEDWEPSPQLLSFLEGGPPPVYVGFGSMSGRDPQRLANIVIQAFKLANVRGILATGWGGLDVSQLPESIFKIDQAPHDWLFPRMAAVVHHGGAGTVAAGLHAGRPSVICPFFGDQPFWGQQVYKLGVGPEPIPQKKLTPENLAAALQQVTQEATMQTRAERLGELIRAENGVVDAISQIERLAGEFSRTSGKRMKPSPPSFIDKPVAG